MTPMSKAAACAPRAWPSFPPPCCAPRSASTACCQTPTWSCTQPPPRRGYGRRPEPGRSASLLVREVNGQEISCPSLQRGPLAAWDRGPHSRPSWPWSGRQAAIRRLPARPRRPRSRPGPAAATQTHYPADPPGAPSRRRQTSARYARSQVLFGSYVTVGRECVPTTLHDEEPVILVLPWSRTSVVQPPGVRARLGHSM